MSDPVVPVPSPVPTAPAERAQFWRDAVAAFAASDLSVREFCRQRGLHERRFYTWLVIGIEKGLFRGLGDVRWLE